MSAEAAVICIDGPSGVGKGTLSRSLASRLGWQLLDSGALYRTVGFVCRERGVALDDEHGAQAVANTLSVRFEPSPEGILVILDGRDITASIRTEEGGHGASAVAAMPAVRQALLGRQRGMATPPGLVADGRDMGTVVFPEAKLKLFLTASAEARAERRFRQLQPTDDSVSLARLLEAIEQRDARDQARSASPLVPASDAVVIDSTVLSAEEVLTEAWELVVAKGIAA